MLLGWTIWLKRQAKNGPARRANGSYGDLSSRTVSGAGSMAVGRERGFRMFQSGPPRRICR